MPILLWAALLNTASAELVATRALLCLPPHDFRPMCCQLWQAPVGCMLRQEPYKQSMPLYRAESTALAMQVIELQTARTTITVVCSGVSWAQQAGRAAQQASQPVLAGTATPAERFWLGS